MYKGKIRFFDDAVAKLSAKAIVGILGFGDDHETAHFAVETMDDARAYRVFTDFGDVRIVCQSPVYEGRFLMDTVGMD